MADHTIELSALDGANPLAFLAALGVLGVGERIAGPAAWRLSWTRRVVASPVLHGPADIEEVVDAVLADRDAWSSAPALEWEGADDVKFAPDDGRRYLAACAAADDGGRSIGLASALVAEGAVDRSGSGKPTDLHFTAGQQKLLAMVRSIRNGLGPEHLVEALIGGWAYDSDLPSLKWDMSDDRLYALSASNPATDKKLTVPGAEWLAVCGLAMFPAYASGQRKTLTTGCEGPWKSGGSLRWPLWSAPLSGRQAATVVQHAHESRLTSLPGWGVFRLYRSQIRRSDQGGYGSFSPSSVVWEAT